LTFVRLSALLLACLISGCREAPVSLGPRNVVLITIDTLRADYVGYSGSGKVETPNLDRLAANGVAFTQARSPVPLTLPSHASLLTAAYPPAHGVRVNGRDRLSETSETLAETLKGKGYETAAFVSSFVLDRRFGLSQGFDVYDDDLGTDVRKLEHLEAERKGGAVVDSFSAWFSGRPTEKPFFAWIHFYDPHAPYEPPEPHRSEYPNDPYAGEVAYTDEMVGHVVSELERGGFLDRTILAVVGDHGEGLGEHGEQTHSLLIYLSTLRVPFLLAAPRLIEGGRTVDALTRTIDIAPTLLDYVGFAPSLGQGRSLRPLIEGGSLPEEPVYSESLYAGVHLGWSELRSLEREGFRYIEAPRPELYDVKNDPHERTDVLQTQRSIARRMKTELEKMGAGSTGPRAEIDEETEARLRSLGYVASTAPPSKGPPVDPKDKMEVWNQIQIGIHEFGRGNHALAASIFEKVLSTEKDVPLVYENLGSLHMEAGRFPQAEAIYREALSRGIEDADFHLDLGRIHYSRREWGEAEKELRVALELEPRSVAARVHLGNTLRSSGRPAEALPEYQRAIETNPRYLYAFDGLGIAYSNLGREEEALQAFREVVRLDPEGAQGHFNLAVQLEEMGRREEALASYRELLNRSASGVPPPLLRRATEAIARLKRKGPK
jgi:arylsulfatase A-like enzyme/Flp pilus assembly protein TadD